MTTKMFPFPTQITGDVVHNAVSIMCLTPDGTVTVIIEESDTDRPIAVHIYLGKAGSSLQAWAQSLSELISMMLGRGLGISHIIQCLSNQHSDKISRTESGVFIQSGPAGVAYCLHRYNKYKQEEGAINVEHGSFRALEY